MQEESPDLEIRDIFALGVGEPAKRRSSAFLGASAVDDDDEELPVPENVTVGMVTRALWGTKKNALGVVGSAAVTALLVVRLVDGQHDDGANWYPLAVIAWVRTLRFLIGINLTKLHLIQAWTTLLALAQLALAFSARIHRLQLPGSTHRVPSWYSHLEMHLIPWLLLYSIIAFFNLRSALLAHFSPAATITPAAFAREVATFAVVLTLFLVEILAPRPSKFSSRSASAPTDGLPRAPEMNASLFSLATFSYIDSFMTSNAFPAAGAPTLPMSSIPDLRPDDKTARVLLSYRRDVAALNAGRGPGTQRQVWGLTARLFWHFRRALLVQQFWSYVRVSVVALPPLFLKGILGHINKRQRGEASPLHVALLYAVALFFFQILGALASSQSLFIGRRICIRLRCVALESLLETLD